MGDNPFFQKRVSPSGVKGQSPLWGLGQCPNINKGRGGGHGKVPSSCGDHRRRKGQAQQG